MEIWQTIVLAIGGNSALLAVLAYIVSRFVEKHFQREIIKFQSELKLSTDSEIEKFKSELQRQTLEHQVRFSRLHQETASTIAETYNLLQRLFATAQEHTRSHDIIGLVATEETHKKVITAYSEFLDYFKPRQIFLPMEVVNNIQVFCQMLDKAITDFEENIRPGMNATGADWECVRCAMDTKMPEILDALDHKFRTLLGSS
jgi:hypothetical protein